MQQAYIPRRVVSHLNELRRYFPVISLTGPRQAGKTTLLVNEFSDYRYVSFEDPQSREAFEADPRGFLATYDGEVIFDEAQRVPELFSYLQRVVDQDRRPGRFVLSGSQNFLLLEGITQSLAGRVGMVRLLPLDFLELRDSELFTEDVAQTLYRGFYPELFQMNMPASFFYPNYVASYLERDISRLVQTSNMSDFRRFLAYCAAMVGQQVNYSAIANALRISGPTVKTWMHYLEQSFIIFRIGPYFNNFGKRLIKTEKLYFYDTGLACYLLRLSSAEALRTSTHYGALFENLIVANYSKTRLHRGEQHPFYFYRDSNGVEVDLLDERDGTTYLTEIKSGITQRNQWAKNLHAVAQLVEGKVQKQVVYGGPEQLRIKDVLFQPWFNALDHE